MRLRPTILVTSGALLAASVAGGQETAAPPCVGYTPEGQCVVAVPAPPPEAALQVERPTTIEGYEALRQRLREDLKAAKRSRNDVQIEEARRRLDVVNASYAEDTERRSEGAFIGGFAMIGVGGATFIAGLITMLVGAFQNFCLSLYGSCTSNRGETTIAVGGVMTLAGLGVGLIGIPVMLSGKDRVMKGAWLGPDARPSPRVSFSVGPFGIGVGGSF